MSNSDETSTPSLTRRQLREQRSTGATPIISSDAETKAEPGPQAVPPRARAADPARMAPAPRADAQVDLGASPLTRRQAREQERIRTASVPVILHDIPEPAPEAVPEAKKSKTSAKGKAKQIEQSEPVSDHESQPISDAAAHLALEVEEEPVAVVNPGLGQKLLEGEAEKVVLPNSFDQLIARGATSTGSLGSSNALILSQTPNGAGLSSPVASTGEVLITGTFALPEGLGSTGHAPGMADGKEADAVLLDGELPAASSPTPIAASAAISTIKSSDDMIRPPAPEKGSRLMLALAITAGALALALVGVLILAFVTGVFS
ncbi:hypothetical protein FHX49_000079 [Microbacterium endophyticum]|uniref:Uncharacterized protein n=1 Tax=Microbacterium endophyticum TaxID=1526412 RepID=A0A7W4V1R5_9MICO|nr:hypothetical protein [Microbacterium endophyticum]MBB2974538.1 hypothetical protein [Microbacterium endophyticum]NIK36835.1 hypothetical protein [Microbacterium endophyticum]